MTLICLSHVLGAPRKGRGPNTTITIKLITLMSQYITFCPQPPEGPQNLTEANQWHIFTLLTILELGINSVLM